MKKILLFLHIPKAGGTTLQSILSGVYPVKPKHDTSIGILQGKVYTYTGMILDTVDAVQREAAIKIIHKYRPYIIIGHFHYGIHQDFQFPYTYATLLRDPVERVVSLFSFQKLVQNSLGSLEGRTIPDDMTLEEFVCDPPYPEVINGQTNRVAGLNGSCAAGEILDRAMSNLMNDFSVIGVLNRFDEFLMMMKYEFAWKRVPFYYPQNQNPNRKKLKVSSRLRELIEKSNSLDMKLYQYACELFRKKVHSYGEQFQHDLKEYQEQRREWLLSHGVLED